MEEFCIKDYKNTIADQAVAIYKNENVITKLKETISTKDTEIAKLKKNLHTAIESFEFVKSTLIECKDRLDYSTERSRNKSLKISFLEDDKKMHLNFLEEKKIVGEFEAYKKRKYNNDDDEWLWSQGEIVTSHHSLHFPGSSPMKGWAAGRAFFKKKIKKK